MTKAITTRQEVKQASKRKTMFIKGEKENLARYNKEGQEYVKVTLQDASLSLETVYFHLSASVAKGFNDFSGNFNTALLWFILQESINSKFGVELFSKLEKTFHIIAGAGLSAKDEKGRYIYDKKESCITISKKETVSKDKDGKNVISYSVNMGLKKGYTRADIAKAWNKRKNGELKNAESICALLLEKYTGTPIREKKEKKELELADIVVMLADFHDTCNDKAQQAKAKAMLDAYKK